MQNIQSIALRIKSDIVAQARQVGCTPQEISALEEGDFFEDAEAEIRAELAALRLNHRRAIRAAMPRQPATRRAPRRAAKKAASSSGSDGDGDGAGPWSLDRIDFFFALGALPILSPTFRDRGTGEFARYRGPSILPRMPHVAISVMVGGVFPHTKTSIHWSDATTGLNGVGVVALVATILKIPESEAASRVVHFYANALAASGSGRNLDRTIALLRKDFVDSYLRRVA
jgi:hypothetical protein